MNLKYLIATALTVFICSCVKLVDDENGDDMSYTFNIEPNLEIDNNGLYQNYLLYKVLYMLHQDY